MEQQTMIPVEEQERLVMELFPERNPGSEVSKLNLGPKGDWPRPPKKYEVTIARMEAEGHEVAHFRHAWRVNGMYDIYKFGPTVRIVATNTFERFDNRSDAFRYVTERIKPEEVKPVFTKLKSGRMKYSEFKRLMGD